MDALVGPSPNRAAEIGENGLHPINRQATRPQFPGDMGMNQKAGNSKRVREALAGSGFNNPVEHEELLRRTGMERGLLGYTLRNMVDRGAVYKRTVYWLPPAKR